ncbi:acetyltransferase [Halalkalibacterium ligniniphilum]|uniref:acetyltransferase n=1 Tax=Halalkalibacterium ligniniphilum TaxID=1134413 RepID=UPI000376BC23|nr:acetyltransferase [Halalkalibacterium ligniniphilum]
MKPIIVLGSGGHSKVVRDMILGQKRYRMIGQLDDKFTKVTKKNSTYIGPLFYANELAEVEKEAFFVVCIGNNKIRKEVVEELKIDPARFATIIHPTAFVSPESTIGRGVVVMPGAVINSGTTIGEHVIINTASVIEHDNQIESFTHISPKAVLAGEVKVGEGAHVGIGSQVIQQINVGMWSVIGAGATVISDIPAYSTAVGVPAKPIKYHQ